MIAEAITAGTRIGWAIVAWICVGAAVATGLCVGSVAGVWWVGQRVGRVSRYAWRALRKPQAPASRPRSPSRGSRDADTPHEAAQAHTAPRRARTEPDRQEAA